LNAKRELGDERLDVLDRGGPLLIRMDEHLGVSACRQNDGLPVLGEGANGRIVVCVARIEVGNQNAGVDDG
jgi:hypothetical protein